MKEGARLEQKAEQVVDMKKPRALLKPGGLLEPPASARPQKDAWRDAIAALADAGLPLFERMRVEGLLPADEDRYLARDRLPHRFCVAPRAQSPNRGRCTLATLHSRLRCPGRDAA